MSDERRTTYYVTTASNHPKGSGYWEVAAASFHEARDKAFEVLGSKWAFVYEDLDDVHALDRRKHGRIG